MDTPWKKHKQNETGTSEEMRAKMNKLTGTKYTPGFTDSTTTHKGRVGARNDLYPDRGKTENPLMGRIGLQTVGDE